jgi:two-component system cell cycle sensor histidine kinase/response regulator CckA
VDERATYILLVEDEEAHAELVRRAFRRASHGDQFHLAVVSSLEDAWDYLAESQPDLIITDWLLPDGQGIELLPEGEARDARCCPVVVMTSHGDEHMAVEAMKAGALDYVVKSRSSLAELPRVAERVLREWGHIAERKQAEEALQQSQARYRALFTGITDAVLVHHITDDGFPGKIIEVNDVACHMLGYSREELMGMGIADIDAPESGVDARRVVEALGAGQDVMFEQVHVAKDGGRIPVEVHAQMFEFKGQSAVLSTARDITDRRRAEEERAQLLMQIQEQVQRMQRVVDTVPEGVLLLDADGRIVMVNPRAEHDLSLLADVRVGDTLDRLGSRPLPDLLVSPPKGLWHEVTIDSPSHRTFEVIAKPIETSPTPGEWVLVIRDVTQQRETEHRVQQQERLAAVGQLAAGIAHDFNNIMATIVLYAQMTARMEGLPARVRKWMATIDRQATHATRLIQQILDFSRRAMLERRPLDLTPFLKEQVQLLKRTLPESIEITLAYGPDEHTVNADPTRIQQAITNLALNARDAMPEGGKLRIGLERIRIKRGEAAPLLEMETAGTAAEEWVRITVSDTGVGIPPDVRPRIFEPFFTTKAPLGSGLGLAQVHGIISQHEGYIDVETRWGADRGQPSGTTFTIYLPALTVRPLESLTAASSTGEASLLERLSAVALGRGETILMVEDDADARKALADTLRILNYRVLEAANGRDALDILEQYGDEIALVLSDVVMPGMGGIALLHALKERKAKVRVVLLTGHPLENELQSLREQGVASGLVDWMFKPPGLEQLAQVVARALKKESSVS